MVVTSGRVEYDAFGRAVAVFYPTVDNTPVESFSVAVDTVAPTETEYDVLDRPVKVRYPDATEKGISYRVVGHTVVTAVADAWGHVTESHVNGSGQTVRSVQVRENGDRLTTSFGYDGIGRLVSVRDAEGNVTTSVYDMADRRLRVTHPASGEAVFTYDALGNMLTRRTASGDTISYRYELGRLKDVLYPKHPEYNVHYHYGGPRHPNNAGGRVRFREDATGGIEYSYDQMGNVSETLRTVVVPNDSVGAGTFRTSFKYDAFGKLLSMTYPDGEVVCYLYDRSGQLVSVYIYDYAANDRYVAAIGYDKFGDRVYMEYGNGTATRYAYDIMRRLDTVYVSMPGGSWLNRTYTYDVVGNITSQDNTGSDTGLLYTPVSHEYGYDDLYRLTSAKGNRDNTENGYTLTMTYDKMYRVKTKNQRLWQTGVQFEGTLRSGYNLSYSYSSAPGRRFQMSTVSDLNYRCEGEQTASDNVYEKHKYRYDANGNIEHVNTARRKADKDYWDLAHEECFRWDEENRLMAISQDGYVSNYWYDADGERVIKEHGNNQAVFVNSGQDSVSTDTRQFTIYPSAYLTVHNGNWYTNHIYIGSERIASHLGTMDPDEGLSFYSEEHSAGAGMDKMLYSVRCDTLVAVMASNYAHFGLPYNGKNRMVHTPRPDLAPSEPGGAEGGMRFYWMMGGAVEGADGNGGPGRSAKSDHGLNQAPKYFYHSDHLGSSSLVTNTSGIVIQQMDYLPYGEVFLEMRADANHSTPYKFNGKELDEETGLYYYGARYMNPRLSIWYGVDPISNYNPINSENYLDGEHNGGVFNPRNNNPYIYCYQNPCVYIDPNGKQIYFSYTLDYKINSSNFPFVESFRYINNSFTKVLYSGRVDDLVIGPQGEYGGYFINLKVPSVSPWNRNAPVYTIYKGKGSDLNNLTWSKEESLANTFIDGLNNGWMVGLSNEMFNGLSSAIFKYLHRNVSKTINIAKQNKHIVSSSNFIKGRSILTSSPQELLKQFHQAKIKRFRVINKDKVIVDFGHPIGEYWGENATIGVPTTKGIIISGKNGAHIVPSRP